MELLNTLADVGFVTPVLAAALVMLLVKGEAEAALRWGTAFLLAAAATGILKSLLRASPDLAHFPSGHVSVAAVFYGGLMSVLLGGRGGIWLNLPPVAAIAFASGWSRVETTAHTWIDVFGGFAVGVAALIVTGCWRMSAPVDGSARRWTFAATLLSAPAGFSSYTWLGHSWRMLME